MPSSHWIPDRILPPINYFVLSAVGAAMQAAYKMVSPTGGRVTVFQHTLPTIGKKTREIK